MSAHIWRFAMRKALFAGLLALPLFAIAAAAQERVIDGALGGAAGGIIFGPVGLVTGAVVGATAGPAIASSWGLKHKRRHYHHRRYVRH
jgi:hypothetical protein